MIDIIFHWELINSFFNSNLFVGIITLIVGFAAYSVYAKQRRDHKRSAATTILLEIENAERQLDKIAEFQKPDSLVKSIYLMNGGSWNKYRELFVRDFDRNEWDKITSFYAKCEIYDDAIRYDGESFGKNVDERRVNIQRILGDFAHQYILASEKAKTDGQKAKLHRVYIERRKHFEDIYDRGSRSDNLDSYSPQKFVDDAKKVLETIEPSISLTSVGIKLKRLKVSGNLFLQKS